MQGGEVAPAGLTGESTAGSLRFGGSGRDQIDYLTLTPDVRIVMAGQTSSSDGTLSDRSKTGLTGWAALVDLQGNTIWNFCSRYGSDDRMRLPVVHEDGTITVLLQSNGNAYSQVELIRLDMEGNVISRKTLVQISKESGIIAPEWPGVFCGGYIIPTIDALTQAEYPSDVLYQPVYRWFDFEGNLLFETQAPWPMAVAQVSQNHVIEVIDESYWLCALDGKGQRIKLAKLYDGQGGRNVFTDLLSLQDGGALICTAVEAHEKQSSVIQKWDAQGNLTGEIDLENFAVDGVQVLQDRLIVCGEMANLRKLMVLDASGKVLS